jgi:hypothetical protein
MKGVCRRVRAGYCPGLAKLAPGTGLVGAWAGKAVEKAVEKLVRRRF